MTNKEIIDDILLNSDHPSDDITKLYQDNIDNYKYKHLLRGFIVGIGFCLFIFIYRYVITGRL